MLACRLLGFDLALEHLVVFLTYTEQHLCLKQIHPPVVDPAAHSPPPPTPIARRPSPAALSTPMAGATDCAAGMVVVVPTALVKENKQTTMKSPALTGPLRNMST